jgi:hypothetical protein
MSTISPTLVIPFLFEPFFINTCILSSWVSTPSASSGGHLHALDVQRITCPRGKKSRGRGSGASGWGDGTWRDGERYLFHRVYSFLVDLDIFRLILYFLKRVGGGQRETCQVAEVEHIERHDIDHQGTTKKHMMTLFSRETRGWRKERRELAILAPPRHIGWMNICHDICLLLVRDDNPTALVITDTREGP